MRGRSDRPSWHEFRRGECLTDVGFPLLTLATQRRNRHITGRLSQRMCEMVGLHHAKAGSASVQISEMSCGTRMPRVAQKCRTALKCGASSTINARRCLVTCSAEGSARNSNISAMTYPNDGMVAEHEIIGRDRERGLSSPKFLRRLCKPSIKRSGTTKKNSGLFPSNPRGTPSSDLFSPSNPKSIRSSAAGSKPTFFRHGPFSTARAKLDP